MSGDRPDQGRRLLDEALRLLDLAQASRPAGASRDTSSHGGPECRVCPVCRGIAYLREIDPQAVARLTGAVADLSALVRDVAGASASHIPERGADPDCATRAADGNGVPRVPVQQIDVTD